jgi:hypothetical protein
MLKVSDLSGFQFFSFSAFFRVNGALRVVAASAPPTVIDCRYSIFRRSTFVVRRPHF